MVNRTSTNRRFTTALTAVERPKKPGYTLNDDLADQAIAWIRLQKSIAPEKPFFVYFAPGATHAPHHVPKEWSDKFKGRFDQGWDKLREEIFERQKKLGVVPANAKLTTTSDSNPGLGIADTGAQKDSISTDGDLRRLPGPNRQRGGPPRGRYQRIGSVG